MAALAARRRKGGTRFVPPKTAEDAVPVRRIWPDGVCLTDDGEYAKTWRVSDVNYAAASKEDKEAMFLGYSDLLNSFDSDARAKVTVAVRRLDAEALGRRILIPPKGDGLDRYREEYNAMLMEKATGANSMVREIYLTIAVGGRKMCIRDSRSNETPFAFRSATCSSGFSIGLSPVTSCAPSPMLHAVYVSLGFTMPAILPLSVSLGHAAFRASRIGMAKRRRVGARRAAPAATGKSEDKKRTKTCHTSTLKSSLK